MHNSILGIDTSNYTTSTALYEAENKIITQQKQLLPVKEGELGLRQSDAVFHHVKQLPTMLKQLFSNQNISAIGVSVRPRDIVGSYMPCFLVGEGTATAMATGLHIPLHKFSHQAGHIMAAIYGANRLSLLQAPFIAFQVSGGTTEAVLVTPNKNQVFTSEIISSSLDLKGGQVVDRVGGMLGLGFPAGKELEALALQSTTTFKVKSALCGANFSLSGIENQCKKMIDEGHPKADVALFCLESISLALWHACGILVKEVGRLPIVFAGGVMSNTIIRKNLMNGYNAVFAPPEYSADNAAGIALLTAIKEGRVSL